IRMRVIAIVLAILLVVEELLFVFAHDLLAHILQRPAPTWLPLRVIGPFLLYETVALLVLRGRLAHGGRFPTSGRFVNAPIEPSLPTVILWWLADLTDPAAALGAWPTLLYFVFIVASTLRLNFVLPAYTGLVAAAGYLGLAYGTQSMESLATNPFNHLFKAGM